MLDFLKSVPCRQFIIWSAKVKFPLDFTAIHIWDKSIDCASYYERIFERNGGKRYMIFRYHPPVYTTKKGVGMRDVNLGHPSQKPLHLALRLIDIFSKENELIFDPFCGVGTMCVAAKMLGRNYIGIEVSKKYCEITEDRLNSITKGCKLNLFDKQKRGKIKGFDL